LSYIFVKSNPIILKGHGVVGWHAAPGKPLQSTMYSAYPPEAVGAGVNPKTGGKIDAPAYAHGGTADPHPSGHAGVGNLIPGKFKIGRHGELAYNTGMNNDGTERNHYHGMDGVIKDLGDALDRAGILGKHSSSLGIRLNPVDILNMAIDETNKARKNAGKSDMLPRIESDEWRTNHVSSFKGKNSINQNVRDNEGKLITQFTNSNPQTLGTFIESYSNPIHLALRNMLLNKLGGEFGQENIDAVFGSKGYIHDKWATIDSHPSKVQLSPNVMRLSGTGGDQLQQGNLPDSFMQTVPEGYSAGGIPSDIFSYEIAHHFPDILHLHGNKTTNANTEKSKNLFRNAINSLKQKGISENFGKITLPVRTATGDYQERSLDELMHEPTGYLDDLMDDLKQTDGFKVLFSRLKNTQRGGKTLQHLVDHFDSKAALGHEGFLSHFVAGEGNPNYQKTLTSEGVHPRAKKIYALAHASGHSEKGTSNLRHYEPEDPSLYAQLGYNVDSLDTVDSRRKGLEGIADIIAGSHEGMKVKRDLIHPDEMPTQHLASRKVTDMGLFENKPNLPSHVSYSTDFETPPPPTEAQAQKVPPGPSPKIDPMPTAQPGVKVAPPITPMAAPAPAPSVPAQVQFPLQQSPELVAARRRLGQASPADFRDVARQANLPVRLQPEGPLSFDEQRYQQAMGDPGQTFLSQYMKSQDKNLSITDRITKAMEDMQMDDAFADDTVMKHALPRPVNIADEFGIRHLAKSVDLTPVDVKTIAHSMGDWERIAKRLNVSPTVVKVIKVSIGGV